MHCHFRALALAVDAALLPYMHLSPDKQFSDVISLVATVFNHATHLQTGGGCGGGATAAAAFVCLLPLPPASAAAAAAAAPHGRLSTLLFSPAPFRRFDPPKNNPR